MKKDNKTKKIKKESLSKKLNTTSEDLAMLQERKNTKNNVRNVCDTHWDGA